MLENFFKCEKCIIHVLLFLLLLWVVFCIIFVSKTVVGLKKGVFNKFDLLLLSIKVNQTFFAFWQIWSMHVIINLFHSDICQICQHGDRFKIKEQRKASNPFLCNLVHFTGDMISFMSDFACIVISTQRTDAKYQKRVKHVFFKV